ncbi:hypothetical protein JTB14_035756 [Gonioctena quinquepunctata]|nr:hypothetical protein JTB14_035756 [Gonioctena quinquepunctata]
MIEMFLPIEPTAKKTLASPHQHVTRKIPPIPVQSNETKSRLQQIIGPDQNIDIPVHNQGSTSYMLKQALQKESTLASPLQHVTRKIHPIPVQSNETKSRLQQIIGPDQDIDRPVHNQGSTASYFAKTKPHEDVVWPKKREPSATIPQYTPIRFDGSGEAKQIYSSTSAKSNSVEKTGHNPNTNMATSAFHDLRSRTNYPARTGLNEVWPPTRSTVSSKDSLDSFLKKNKVQVKEGDKCVIT